jgi:DNA end-binding protein Ku
LYSAIAAQERLSFRRVNRRTGNRLRQQFVDDVTGEAVSSREPSFMCNVTAQRSGAGFL